MRKQILHAVLVLLLGAGTALFLAWPAPKALAANPTTINFQGRVTNPDGTNETSCTTNCSFVFRLYDQSSPTTTGSCSSNTHCWWEETDTLNVTNGIFQVQLGATCAFSSACNSSHSGINWNTNNALYLTMQFNSDSAGFMSPTVPLTSVPYAYNADSLGGIGAGGFIQNTSGVQSSSNFHISGTGQADTALQAPSFDSETSAATLGIGTANAGVITLGNVTNSTFIFKAKTSSTAYQIENSSSKNILAVDTSANQVLIGTAGTSGINGLITFNTTTASSFTVGLQPSASTTASYVLTLPTSAGSANQCLANSGTAGILTFASCGGGGTLASDYNSTGTSGNTITYTTAGAGIVIQDAATPLTGNLLTLQNNTGSYLYLTFSLASSVPHLRVYGASSSNYADIYYDSSTSTAVFAASTGTTQLGAGTGNITFSMTAPANAESHTHSGALAAGYTSTDYTFTRNLTGGSFAVQGDVLSVIDTSTFTSGSSSPTLVYINQNNTSATGYLIQAQTGGSSTKLSVDTAGNAIFAGSVTVQSASGVTVGTSSAASKLVFYSNGNNTVSLQGSSSLSGSLSIFLPANLGSANQCLVNSGTPGVLQFSPCGAGSTASVTLSPEFVGAVMTAANDGVGHAGTMTSDFCGNDGGSNAIDVNTSVCAAGQYHNYYSWTANATNDYDIWAQWQAPSDFSSFSGITFNAWVTTTTNDSVQVTVYNAGVSCGSQTVSTSGGWQTSSAISTSGCSGGSAISAGTKLFFDIRLKVGVSADFARMGEINIIYNRK